MSRIGLMPVVIPDGVDVNIKGSHVYVKGPKGELSQQVNPDIKVSVKEALFGRFSAKRGCFWEILTLPELERLFNRFQVPL